MKKSSLIFLFLLVTSNFLQADLIDQLFYKRKFIYLLFAPFHVFWNSSKLTKVLFSVGIVGGLLLLRNKNSSSFGHHKKLTPLEIQEIEKKRDSYLEIVKNKITQFKQNYLVESKQNQLTDVQAKKPLIQKEQTKLATEIANLLSELKSLDYHKEGNLNKFIQFRTDLAHIVTDFQNMLKTTVSSELRSFQDPQIK